MTLTKVRNWNNTEPGKTAQAVIMGIRGSTDGEAYVLEADPAVVSGIPVSNANPLRSVQTPAYRDYSSSNITNAAWFTFVALTANVRELEIFDSSGEIIDVSIDGGVNILFTITPGGNERVPEVIASGSTISIRSKSAALVNSGVLLMNLRG
jgi:hypothetical protein